jgi:hypothetical protein
VHAYVSSNDLPDQRLRDIHADKIAEPVFPGRLKAPNHNFQVDAAMQQYNPLFSHLSTILMHLWVLRLRSEKAIRQLFNDVDRRMPLYWLLQER